MFVYISGNSKKFAILTNLGATFKQRFTYNFSHSIIVLLLSIPLGAVFGYAGYNLLAQSFRNIFLNDYIVGEIQASTIFISILIYAILVLVICIIISVLSVRKHKVKVSGLRNMRRTTKTSSPNILLVYRDALNNMKRFVFVVIMIALCIVIFTLGSLAGESAMTQTGHIVCDYSLGVTVRSYAGPLFIPMDEKLGFTHDELKYILEDPAIEQSLLIKGLGFNFMNAGDIINDLYEGAECRPFSPKEASVNEYINELKKYNYNESYVLYRTELFGVADDDFDKLGDFEVFGTINREKFLSGEEIVICINESNFKEEYKNVIGDTIDFTQIINFNSETDFGERVDFKVNISAIIVIPKQNEIFIEAFSQRTINFITSNNMLENIGVNVYYQGAYIKLFDMENSGDIEYNIAELKRTNSVHAVSRNQANIELQKQKNIVAIATAVLVTTLTCIAFMIIIIHYFIKMNERKHLYKRLYVMGMTSWKLNILLLWDYIFYLMMAYLMAIPTVVLLIVSTHYTNPHWVNIQDIVVRNLFAAIFLLGLSGVFVINNFIWIRRNIVK